MTLVDSQPSTLTAATIEATAGTHVVGPYEGSGLGAPTFLVQRGDGRMVQVTGVNAALLEALEAGPASPRTLAEVLSARLDAEVTPSDIARLVERLMAIGLVRRAMVPAVRPAASTLVSSGLAAARPVLSSGSAPRPAPFPPPAPRPAPPPAVVPPAPALLLRIRGRCVLLRPAAVAWLGRRLASLLWWPFLTVLGLSVVASDIGLLRSGDIGHALAQVAASPEALLEVIALAFASVCFHELGHAAACVRGGARPGPIGCGLYLTMPVLFTDVTDSYRLTRRHRLLVDLGGICFNGIAAVGFFVAYRSTGHAPFLVLVLVQHSIALQQLAPFVRLDGYWVLSDMAGVPDLFRYLPTVVLGRGRRPDPLFDRLRVAPRRTIVVWAWTTVVALVGQALFTLLLFVPLVRLTVSVIEPNLRALAHIFSDPVAGLSAAVNLFFTCSPLIGLVLVASTLLRRFWSWCWTRSGRGLVVRTTLIASSALAVATPVVIGGRW